MKILTCTSPGNFNYGEAGRPVLTKGNTVIRIKRIGICGTDLHAFEGTQPFFNYPRILGHELSGEIEDSDDATEFKKGDTVTFIPYFNCGKCIACRNGKPNCCLELNVCGVHSDGGMVEYLSVPSYSLVASQGLTLESLALAEPLAIGAHGVSRANVKPGEYVLVLGAGPIGLAIIAFTQIAGGKVIVLDVNDTRLAHCKNKMKVDHAINASRGDVKEQLTEITQGDMPSVVIDATGNIKAINNAFQYIAHGGRYVLVGLQKEMITFSHPEFHKRETSLMSSRNATRNDFEYVIDVLKKGLIDPADFITHKLSFAEVKNQFPRLLDPANGVIKAMVEIG